MDGTGQTSFGSDALDRLSQTLSQYQTSRIATIPMPEFKGLPNEDVHEFLKRFKIAALPLDDKTRWVALKKALGGPAHRWAKHNLESLIDRNDWKTAKKMIIDRFALPNQGLRHQERLSKLKFDAKESTLMSYIEVYADTYRKAYAQAKDIDVVRSLRLNLPNEIIRDLNLLSDGWSASESLSTLYQLVRRLESKILPYTHRDDSVTEKVDIVELSKMLQDIQSAIIAGKGPSAD